MRRFTIQWGIAGLVLLSIAGCGGGSSESVVAPPAVSSPVVKAAIDSASAVSAKDTAINSSASFTVLQDVGFSAITVDGPPVVNFAVFSDGKVMTGLTINDVRFAIAKLVPGTNGDPDQWVSYVNTTKTANIGPGNALVPKATAMQATTDSKLSLEANEKLGDAGQFVYNSDGYYTYTFKTDITQTSKTGGVVYDPSLTHRVAIQLSYKNAAGETILVNPYFDFTVVNGKSVTVTDPAKTRKMTDVASCNGCHEKLGLHGGGRVDTQYCVMCHNPGTSDPDSGNNLNLATMVHTIHAGKLLKSKGEPDYVIWGYQNPNSTNPTGKHNYAEVGFPQDLRNCTVCHSGANPKTPQGDNWKSKPSKEACLTCHASSAGSDWDTSHSVIAVSILKSATAKAKDMSNQFCAGCHNQSSNIAPERVHWNQNEENAAKYKMNIESTTFDATARMITVKYFLSDPTNGNAAYNLVTPECTGTTTITCASTTQFGNLRFYLAYQNMVGQSDGVTEYSAYNNGGSSANAYAYKGTNDGSNHYTVDIPLPADSVTAVAKGTARVVSIGQVKEAKLQVKALDPRPEVVPKVLINTLVQNTSKELALTGVLLPRRTIVSNEKCNVCHGSLGATSGSNTLAEAFHEGARNTVEACVICHDPNRMSSTIMTNGLALNESYQFKRMIHGIHGNSRRVNPFTYGNPVLGSFTKDGSLLVDGSFLFDYTIRNFNNASKSPIVVVSAGTPVAAGSTFGSIATVINTAATSLGYKGNPVAIENYAAEVAWPGVGVNCNACHVNNSYMQDFGTLGAVVKKDAGVTNPNDWKVISPKAASCTACHDSSKAIGHVTTFSDPPASFGDKTQAQIAGLPREGCDDCHASGKFKGVDIVHGQK